MSSRQYLNSYFAPVIRWEKKFQLPASERFNLDTKDMVLLSQTKGNLVKPSPYPAEVLIWTKALNKPPVDLVDEVVVTKDEDEEMEN